jgi:hypothetical protein
MQNPIIPMSMSYLSLENLKKENNLFLFKVDHSNDLKALVQRIEQVSTSYLKKNISTML